MRVIAGSSRGVVVVALGAALAAGCSSKSTEPALCGDQASAGFLKHAFAPAGSRVAMSGQELLASTSQAPVVAALGCELAPEIPAGEPFTVSGRATYDFVPATYSPSTGTGRLDFTSSVPTPIRGAVVEVQQCGSVLATTATDGAGHYSVTFTPGATGQVSVYVLARTTTPPVAVRDNTAGATWAVAQPIASASPTLDVHATHGWTGSSYGPSRIAAPFAILDSVYTASHRLLDIPRGVPFDEHPLTVNWSPANAPAYCWNGIEPYLDPAQGCIGTSFYDPSTKQIYLLGADGEDTDEFDREVVVHEWGHYFEDNFSRADSTGGPHGIGDVLDPRLSFGEGYASAFAAMLLQQTIYADTYWDGGMTAFGWDVETAPGFDDPRPSAFSELSIIRAMWDLYDGGTNEAWDGSTTGLGPIYDALVGPERTTPALTTLASFVAGLKAQAGVNVTALDAVLAHYAIGAITSEWGDGDTQLRGIYTNVAAPSSTPLEVVATLNGAYAWNERPQNQYFVFTATGAHASVTTSSAYDVDLYAVHGGTFLDYADSMSGCEAIGFNTVAGEIYVVILTGWGGLSSGQCVGEYPATVTFSN